MFIPTWILILVIAGATLYYFKKNRKVIPPKLKITSKSGAEETKGDWLDDENWKEKMLEHLSKYPQQTGKKTPTYDEMLGLEKDEFKAWLFVRAEASFQKELLEEMIEHEEKTNSFAKTGNDGDSPFTKLIFDVFDRKKSKEVVDVLRRMSETANNLIDEGAEGKKGDVVKNAIWAKATSDYFKLGEKVENDKRKS